VAGGINAAAYSPSLPSVLNASQPYSFSHSYNSCLLLKPNAFPAHLMTLENNPGPPVNILPDAFL